MNVTGVKCKTCGTIVYSRARHDFRYCPCGHTFVDGGLDYLKFGHSGSSESPEIVSVELPNGCTAEVLYDDWNKSMDKYGIVKNGDLLDEC